MLNIGIVIGLYLILIGVVFFFVGLSLLKESIIENKKKKML